jgi:DNA topoisomerase VI subunit A
LLQNRQRKWCRFSRSVGLAYAVHVVVARVERLDDASCRPALASGVGAFDHDEQTGSDAVIADLATEGQTEREEALLCRLETLLVFAVGELRR